MAGPIVYDGTGLPPSRYPLGTDLAEVNNAAVEPDEPNEPEATAETTQEPQEQANTESAGNPADDGATSLQNGTSVTEDAGAATLAALGL